MRLSRVELRNFKRFTDLTIADIPPTAKLVLLIGANGSGKSSVFDAFQFLSVGPLGSYTLQAGYYGKSTATDARVKVATHDNETAERIGGGPPSSSLVQQFYGRSSVRIVPRATPVNASDQLLAANTDAPLQYIEPDTRFNADVQLYTANIARRAIEVLTRPGASGGDAELDRIRTEQIAPLNESLSRVFGTEPSTAIQLVNWEPAGVGTAPVLEFTKGASRIPYDLLSHGEKQVVILLLNFMVRRDHLQDKVIFIDEMDNHMHRALQYRLLEEIVTTWIPDSSQLWTASHALGFIEFARDSPGAVIYDFDEFDFDVPQTLQPIPTTAPDLFELAISKELVVELASRRRIVFVEGNDARYSRSAD